MPRRMANHSTPLLACSMVNTRSLGLFLISRFYPSACYIFVTIGFFCALYVNHGSGSGLSLSLLICLYNWIILPSAR